MTRAFPNFDQRAFPIAAETTRFPNGGGGYINPAADPFWDQVQIAMPFDGVNSGTPGNQSSVEQTGQAYFSNGRCIDTHPKFGTTYYETDGLNDQFRWDDNTGMSIGSHNFTIDLWIWRNTLGDGVFFSKYGGTVSIAEYFFNITEPNVQFAFFYGTGANSFEFMQQSWEVTTGGWHHMAVDRVGHQFWTYVDGTMMNSLTSTNRFLQDTTQRPSIAARPSHPTPQYFNGGLDDVRYTKGTGRYGGVDFTPPTAPFPLF